MHGSESVQARTLKIAAGLLIGYAFLASTAYWAPGMFRSVGSVFILVPYLSIYIFTGSEFRASWSTMGCAAGDGAPLLRSVGHSSSLSGQGLPGPLPGDWRTEVREQGKLTRGRRLIWRGETPSHVCTSPLR
jgi:hypothetical protein